jgi:site-specific DNA-methyltransferase (adenine-specific)
MEHGTGAINIDACRIESGERDCFSANEAREGEYSRNPGELEFGDSLGFRSRNGRTELDRWPANLILCHMPDCCDTACAMDCPVFMLNERSGGAAEFFYTAKASRDEREAGLHGLESHAVNDGRKTDIDNPYQRGDTQRKNTHPTVKPMSIMRWLVRLVCKRGGTVLDPFCGSGTTGVACKFEEVNFIGIDLEQKHVEIARKRIAQAALDAGAGTPEDAEEVGGPAQLGLFR